MPSSSVTLSNGTITFPPSAAVLSISGAQVHLSSMHLQFAGCDNRDAACSMVEHNAAVHMEACTLTAAPSRATSARTDMLPCLMVVAGGSVVSAKQCTWEATDTLLLTSAGHVDLQGCQGTLHITVKRCGTALANLNPSVMMPLPAFQAEGQGAQLHISSSCVALTRAGTTGGSGDPIQPIVAVGVESWSHAVLKLKDCTLTAPEDLEGILIDVATSGSVSIDCSTLTGSTMRVFVKGPGGSATLHRCTLTGASSKSIMADGQGASVSADRCIIQCSASVMGGASGRFVNCSINELRAHEGGTLEVSQCDIEAEEGQDAARAYVSVQGAGTQITLTRCTSKGVHVSISEGAKLSIHDSCLTSGSEVHLLTSFPPATAPPEVSAAGSPGSQVALQGTTLISRVCGESIVYLGEPGIRFTAADCTFTTQLPEGVERVHEACQARGVCYVPAIQVPAFAADADVHLERCEVAVDGPALMTACDSTSAVLQSCALLAPTWGTLHTERGAGAQASVRLRGCWCHPGMEAAVPESWRPGIHQCVIEHPAASAEAALGRLPSTGVVTADAGVAEHAESSDAAAAVQEQLHSLSVAPSSAAETSTSGDGAGASSPACAACGGGPPPGRTRLLVCSGCKAAGAQAARYCSTQCQRAHWPQHKAVCRQLRAGLGQQTAA